MNDKQLLMELLEADYEDDVKALLLKRGLFDEANSKRWVPLGKMPNNQSIVQAQQSTPAAALVEKFTNGLDAILLRRCKAQAIDPRSVAAPSNMSRAVQKWFGDLSEKSQQEIRTLAEENLVLYATGSRSRPCLSFYDAGEGQLPENFPSTFCSLIYGSDEGAYKGAVQFVQGRFNMVAPACCRSAATIARCSSSCRAFHPMSSSRRTNGASLYSATSLRGRVLLGSILLAPMARS